MRGWLIWLAVAAIATLTLLLGSDTLRLLAVPLALLALLRLAAFARAALAGRLPRWLPALAGPVLLLAAVLWLYGRLLLGDMPVNHDHPVFLYRAFNTWQHLAAGSWFGYSPYLFLGYPANQLYPIGVDLAVCLVRALSFGWLGFGSAYSLVLFSFVLARTLAFWALGRRLAGAWAGLVAGLLSLADRGAWMQGGWSFDLDWGVVSMGLSFALCLWTILETWQFLHRPRRLGAALPAMLLAGALLCHPQALVLLGLALPLLVGVEALGGRLGPVVNWLPRLALALGLGAALSSFWLVPFLAQRQWFEPLAARWLSYPEMIRGLWSANLLRDFSPWLLVCGLVGLVWAALRRRPFAGFWLLYSGLLLALAASDVLLELRLLERFPSLANLQLERLSYPVRAAALLGCGALAGLLLELLPRTPTLPARWSWHPRRALQVVLAGLVLAPLVVYAPRTVPLPYLVAAPPLRWSSRSPDWQQLKMAAAYLAGPEAAHPGRVVIRSQRHDHLLMALPVLSGRPVFKIGFTPENNYRFKFSSEDPRVWQAVGASHLLSVGPYPHPELEPLRNFGRLYLYRLRTRQPQPAWLQGPGEITVLEDRPERLRLRLSGTTASSLLVVRRAIHGLWRAYLNGEARDIKGAAVGDSPPVFVSLAASDGEVLLEFQAGPWEWWGGALSLLALLLLLLLVVASAPGRLGRRLAELLRRPRPRFYGLVSLCAVLLAVLAAAWLLLRLVLPATPDLPGRPVVLADLSDHLAQARAVLLRGGRRVPCQPFDGQRLQCPGPEWNYVGPTLIGADHLLRRCLWLHPVQGAEVLVEFTGVPLGKFLEGYYGLDDAAVEPPGGQPVEFTVYLDGQAAGTFTCPSRRGWHHWRVDTSARAGQQVRVGFSSRTPFAGRRHFCFTAYVTAGASSAD